MPIDFPNERLICAPRTCANVLVTAGRINPGAAVEPCAGVIAPEGEAFGVVSVYLIRVTPPEPGAPPPVLHWELRARHAGLTVSEPIGGASGTLSKWSAWSSEGSVVHVTGHLCTGFELWMRAATGQRVINCNVQFMLGGPACGPHIVTPGELV